MQSYLACLNQVLSELCYDITAEMEALQFNTHSLLKLELVGHDPRWPINIWVDGDPNAVDIKHVLVCCEHPIAVYLQHAKELELASIWTGQFG